MEKIKLFEDGTKIYSRTHEIESAISAINGPLKNALKSIGFDLTQETFADCISGGERIYNQYMLAVENDVAAVNVPATKKMIRNAAVDAFNEFNDAVASVLRPISKANLKYISIRDGAAVFSDADKTQLIEECTVYISDEEQIKLYRLHLAACKALDEYFQGNLIYDWHHHFQTKDGRFLPERIDYGAVLQRIKSSKMN